MLVSKECWERGCSCYDDRVDKDPVEVVKREWVGLTAKDLAEIPPSAYEGAIWADAKLKKKNT